MAESKQGELKEVGSLWNHKGKSKEIYLSGSIKIEELLKYVSIDETATIFVFPNKFREKGTKQPNWRLMLKASKNVLSEAKITAFDEEDDNPFS